MIDVKIESDPLMGDSYFDYYNFLIIREDILFETFMMKADNSDYLMYLFQKWYETCSPILSEDEWHAVESFQESEKYWWLFYNDLGKNLNAM